MPNPAAAQGGNLKLRGLLTTSRDHLRRRHLKKAIYSAQIAQDFAVRSGEGPEIAAAAQLLKAEAYIINAAYTCDEDLRRQGWQLIEQLEADTAPLGTRVDAHDLAFTKALGHRRLGNFEQALEGFATLAAQLDQEHPRYAATLVHWLGAIAQVQSAQPGDIPARATAAIQALPSDERPELLATLALANAYIALRSDQLSKAIDEAHIARRVSTQAELPELESLALNFIGKLSRIRGNHQIALRLLYDAMDTAERLGYRPLVVEAHLNIGQVFTTLQNDREAEKYFTFVVEQATLTGDAGQLYASSLALGCGARKSGNLSDATTHFNKALTTATAAGWLHEQGIALSELAALNLEGGQHGLAGHLIVEAERRFAEGGKGAYAKTRLTQAQLLEFETPEAIAEILSLGEQAVALAEAEQAPELAIEALRLKARAYSSQEEYVEALECEREASRRALHLLHQQRERQLPDLNMRAALQEKEREIEELTRENELKNAIVEKNEAIGQANRELMQANEELRQFAFVASHDLKEPLRQIGSYVGLIRRMYVQQLDERGETFFNFITEGVERLNRLLDSLMHYTAIARIDKEFEQVELSPLVHSIRQELEAAVSRADAQLKFEDLPSVRTSEPLLRHVLFALIDNALKFQQTDVPTVVRVSYEEQEDMHLIGVHDNGIGIPEEYQDKVFTLFQMLHAKSAYPGTGVGLAIAQKTVQRLGGRIWFESAGDNQGTSFYLTLPIVSREEDDRIGTVEVDLAEAA